MTTHLYITKVELFTSPHSPVEFLTNDGSKMSPPTMLDGERQAVPPPMDINVVHSTRFSQYALDKHGRKTVVHVSLGLSQEVETALSMYIGSNQQLREDNERLLEEVCIEGQRAVCAGEALSTCRSAGFWQRLKWVFTGVQL